MAILDFPTLSRRPSEVTWKLKARTQTHESPLDGSTQTLALPGARWEAAITWNTLESSDRRILEAFLAQLGGQAGRFYLGPGWHAPRRATGTGTPLINGAQSVSTINMDGWAAGAEAFKTGDYFCVFTGGSPSRALLYIVTADATADGGGAVAVSVAPPVRTSVADNSPVYLDWPVATMRLADDDQGSVTVRPPMRGSFTISIVEALV